MRELFRDYWDKIAKSPLYWIPLVVFSFAGYGFSICNRTIHGDDLLKGYYHEVLPFSSRWGMVVWSKLIGITDLVPFVDRFVTLLFLIAASFFIGVLFYYLKNKCGDVLSYTVLSSMILTYPLVNEIFEYTEADVQYAGNLALMVLSFIYLTVKRDKPSMRVILIASIIMILPASSYEASLFSYVTLLCAVILYKYLTYHHLTFKEWLYENTYYISPLLLAVAYRFIVHFTLLSFYGVSSVQVGGSAIDYDNFTLSYLIGSNVFKYFVAGLVYFPITIFVFSSIIFAGIIIPKSIVTRSYKIVLLAISLYVSVFSLAFIRGLCIDYRIAQTVTVFVAFVAFLLCEINQSKLRLVIPSALLCLCWHQAVYLNNILSLNNMRSNNEILSLHHIGDRIVSEFGNRKPVVFIAERDPYGGYVGPWITKRVYADVNTWNGRLFDKLVRNYLPKKYHHYKYVNSNVNNILNWMEYDTLRDFFNYCGYNINIVSLSSVLSSEKDPVKRKRLDIQIQRALVSMNPLEIRDVEKCLLVRYY